MTNYWKKLIHCVSCSKRLNKNVYFNIKRDRGSTYLLCSRRKNFSDCEERILKESELVDYVIKHLEMQGKEFSIDKLKLFVLRIDIEDDVIIIRYRDGTTSKISENEVIF
jgi:hypothetical protein